MFADREDVEAELVGQSRLLEQFAHALLRRDTRAEIGEGGEAKFKVHAPNIAGSCARNYLR